MAVMRVVEMVAVKVDAMVAVKAEKMVAVKAEQMVAVMDALSVHMRVEMTDHWTVYRMAVKKGQMKVGVLAEWMAQN